MSEYHVIWEMMIDARTPREAAVAARYAQIRNGSTATVFDVTNEQGTTVRVDLLEEAP